MDAFQVLCYCGSVVEFVVRNGEASGVGYDGDGVRKGEVARALDRF